MNIVRIIVAGVAIVFAPSLPCASQVNPAGPHAKPRARDLGIPFDGTRHAFATHLLEAGVNLRTIQVYQTITYRPVSSPFI